MTAAEVLNMYQGMSIAGAHPTPSGGVILELGLPGRLGVRRWVTITGVYFGDDAVEVTETADPPAPTYRNRRGETWGQHQIDQGDDRAERDREQNDDRYDVT